MALTHVVEKKPEQPAGAPAFETVLDEVLRGIPPLLMRLMTHSLGRAMTAIRKIVTTLDAPIRNDPFLSLIASAMRCVDRAENRIQEIESHLGIQEAALRFATSPVEREALILETCRFLRRTPAQVRGDRKALKRWFDWEAVLELARRAQHSAHRYQQTLIFVAARGMARCGPERGMSAAEIMERTGFTAVFQRSIAQKMPIHLEREWIDAVCAILRAHQNPKRGVIVDPTFLHALAVRAQNPFADVWVQCSSLYAWLIASPPDALRLARQRLRNPAVKNRDEIFVRRYLVERAPEILDEMQTLDLIQTVLQLPDPSPHVRQGAILALGDQEAERAWPVMREHMLMKEEWEPVPEVRAAMSITLGKWAELPGGAEIAMQEWRLLFEREQDAMPLKIAIRHAGNALENLVSAGKVDGKIAEQFVLEILEKGVARPWPLPVRIAAEEMLERVRVAALPGFKQFREDAMEVLASANREDQVELSVDDPQFNEDHLGRFLAWLSRRTYGLYALRTRHGWRVTVGHQRRWRLWRWIHESLNPAPDKRQAISHVIARRYEGTLRAHSPLLGEESPTKVPGEPVQMSAEGGWRRFLPLVDDFLDSLEFGPVRVYSSEGLVLIDPPAGRKARWLLKWKVSRAYPVLSALREQSRFGNPEAPPCAYVEKMRSMGFKCEFYPNPPPELSIAMPYFNLPQMPGEGSA